MRVAIIPARGGSKRVPRKNIRLFHGKPIIEYSIALCKPWLVDAVVVSTDDAEIARIATYAGAHVIWRAPDDGSKGTQEVAADVLRVLSDDVDTACVLYATCPLLTVGDLAIGLNALVGHQFSMSVQADPLADAGAFYWGKAEAFRKRLPLIAPHTAMVPIPANRVCDINTLDDWARAESMYEALRRAA